MNQRPPHQSLTPVPITDNRHLAVDNYQPGYGYGGTVFEEEPGFDPLTLLLYLVKYRWMIGSFILAGFVAGVLIFMLQAPMYRATAMVEITPQGARVLEDLQSITTNNDLRTYETARLKFESIELAKRVSFELNLPQDKVFLASIPSFSLQNLFDRAFGRQRIEEIDDIEPEERNQIALKKISENLSASLVRNTAVVQVSYEHPDPEKAQLVASQTVKSYIDLNVDRKIETSSVARDFIQEQVIESKNKLEASEKALVDYARDQSITITGDSVSLTVSKITEVNKALSETINERLTIERLVGQIEEGFADTLPAVFESASIQNQREKLTELQAEYSQKLVTLKPGFPEMIQLKRQIDSISGQIGREIKAIAQSTRIQFDQIQQKEVSLAKELEKLEAEDSAFQEKNIQYTILKRQADSDRAQYQSLISKLNEVGVGAELRVSNAVIVELPQIPEHPVSPKLLINVALALVLSMGLCGAIITLLEWLNNAIVGPNDIEEQLKLPVLGILPKVDSDKLTGELANPTSGISEAYRSLRTSLQFSGAELDLKTIAVTSSEPSEGKSTTTLQLAREFAKLGRNVLIIDADMRRPNLHRLLKVENALGLSNLLSNVVPQGVIRDVFRKVEGEKITFISAGTVPPNPADLLVSERMGLVLHACTKNYDLVIIDCPPVIGLSDAPIIARQMESTLFVVGANSTSRQSAENSIKRLNAAGANVIGAALNRFEADRLENTYSYKYMNYNYYNYAQAGDPEKLLESNRDDGSTIDQSDSARGSVRDFLDGIQRRFGQSG